MTLQELLVFCDLAEEKGLLKPNTARSNKAVLIRIASIMDQEEQNHMDQLDPELIFERFKTKYEHDLSAESLRVYKSRFLSILDFFKKWQQQEQGGLSEDKTQLELRIQKNLRKGRTVLPEIPVPMEDSSVVKIINLPQDLSFEEAARLKKIIEAYIK